MTESRLVIEQPEGYRPIHVWADADGGTWGCCAYDHSPMCRLCQPVDETMLGLLQQCQAGNMVARAKASGEFEFKVTQKGVAAAEALVHGDVEMAAMWAELERRRTGGDAE